jgi:hypothetical protein
MGWEWVHLELSHYETSVGVFIPIVLNDLGELAVGFSSERYTSSMMGDVLSINMKQMMMSL